MTPGFYNTKNDDIVISLSSNVDKASIDDIITYTINIKNISNTHINASIISASLSSGIKYKENSLYINKIPNFDEDITKGLLIESIPKNEEIIITFDTIVASLPKNGIIESLSTINYNIYNRKTNTFTNNIKSSPSFIIKSLTQPQVEDYFTVDAIAVDSESMLSDYENDYPIDPSTNINVYIPPKKPSRKTMEYLRPLTPTHNHLEFSSVRLVTFKEVNLENLLVLSSAKIDIPSINAINVSLKFLDFHYTKSVRGKSLNNLESNNCILSTTILATYHLEYTANNAVQTMHTTTFERAFSTYIVLPEDYDITYPTKLDYEIESVNYSMFKQNKIYCNTLVLLLVNHKIK